MGERFSAIGIGLLFISFGDEAIDVNDIVNAGKDGHGNGGIVDRGEEVLEEVEGIGGKISGNGKNLNESIEFTGERGTELAEPGSNIDNESTEDNKDIAADGGGGKPEGDRREESEAWQGEDDKSGNEEKFIGHGIKDLAEMSLLVEVSCDEAVDAVGNGRYKEDSKSGDESLIIDGSDEDRDENQSEDSQKIGDVEDGGHGNAGDIQR